MMLGSFFFKHKARQALKGTWQTALLVTFFSGIFLTVAQVAQSVTMKDINPLMSSLSMTLGSMPEGITPESAHYHEVLDLYRRLYAAITSVPQSTWMLLLGGNLLALVVSPVLNVSLSHYFIRRIDGEDIGFAAGLTARLNLFFRSLWLYVIMAVKIFLWSLLFIIPGIIAALRYSMAAFYLAEDPSLTARQAIRKSKDEIKQYVESNYYDLSFTLNEIRPKYRFDVSCSGSVPQAIVCFLEATDFEDAVRNAVSLGGDCDTQAAIAGSIAEAFFGIPDALQEEIFEYLDETLQDYYWSYADTLYEL